MNIREKYTYIHLCKLFLFYLRSIFVILREIIFSSFMIFFFFFFLPVRKIMHPCILERKAIPRLLHWERIIWVYVCQCGWRWRGKQSHFSRKGAGKGHKSRGSFSKGGYRCHSGTKGRISRPPAIFPNRELSLNWSFYLPRFSSRAAPSNRIDSFYRRTSTLFLVTIQNLKFINLW